MVLKKLWSSLKDLLPIILVIAFFQIVVLRQPVQDLMQKAVFSIDGMASVKEAVAMMRTSKVGELIVAKRNQDDAWGIITISDLIKHIVVPGRDPEDVLVYEIMTKPALTISAQMDIRYAIRIMQRIGKPYSTAEMAAEVIASRPTDREKAEGELLNLVCSNRETKAILEHYGTTRANIQEHYRRLSAMGLGRWIRENYAAAAAIALKPTLTYLLDAVNSPLPDGWSDNDRWMKIATDLVTYFESGSLGSVRSQIPSTGELAETSAPEHVSDPSSEDELWVAPDYLAVTRTAEEVGMGFDTIGAPVAVSRAVWDECIVWTDEDARRQAYQEQDARLWDVMFTAGGTLQLKINHFLRKPDCCNFIACQYRNNNGIGFDKFFVN